MKNTQLVDYMTVLKRRRLTLAEWCRNASITTYEHLCWLLGQSGAQIIPHDIAIKAFEENRMLEEKKVTIERNLKQAKIDALNNTKLMDSNLDEPTNTAKVKKVKKIKHNN